MSIHNKFRITLEAHGDKASIEKPRSDLDVHEMEDAIKYILLASGWSVKTVDIRLGDLE